MCVCFVCVVVFGGGGRGVLFLLACLKRGLPRKNAHGFERLHTAAKNLPKTRSRSVVALVLLRKCVLRDPFTIIPPFCAFAPNKLTPQTPPPEAVP